MASRHPSSPAKPAQPRWIETVRPIAARGIQTPSSRTLGILLTFFGDIFRMDFRGNRKEVKMDAATKIAKQRLSVLQLAKILGNVSEACRRRGMARSRFYEYKRRFQTHGLEGLKDLPPIHKLHPQTTPPQVVKKILNLALKHPAWGCNRLERLLKADGISVSSVTIQKTLKDSEQARPANSLSSAVGVGTAACGARDSADAGADRLHRETESVFPRASRGIESSKRVAESGHVLRGTPERRGESLLTCGGGHIRQLRVRLSAHLQASGSGGGGHAQ